jgi:chaperonin GroES
MAKKSTKKSASKSGKMTVRPLGEKVLIQRMEAETTTKGGIVLPDTAKEKPQKGTVMAVGDGRLLGDGTRAEHQVSKGDTVLFASYAGTEIKVNGEELMLMDESDILAILD